MKLPALHRQVLAVYLFYMEQCVLSGASVPH